MATLMMRMGVWVIAALASLLLTGCAQWVVQRIVTPPASPQMAYQASLEIAAGITATTWQTPDGAQLVWYDVPAAQRGFRYVFQRDAHGAGFDVELGRQPAPKPALGTVVYLHGWSR